MLMRGLSIDPLCTVLFVVTLVISGVAMAVTAHEVGHALQHAEGTVAMRARAFLVPAVTFSPMLSHLLIVPGLIFGLTGLLWLGIVVVGLMVLFSIPTLPVEIGAGATRRALVMPRASGLLVRPEEEPGVRGVLTSAAVRYVAAPVTYVAAAVTSIAAAVTSILTLLYCRSLARR
jgi:hypothetical protein